MKRSRVIHGLCLIASAFGGYGCGNAVSCALYGDNLKGHIDFTSAIPPSSDKRVILERSIDGGGTFAFAKNLSNSQGLLSLSYTLCVDNDVNVAVRAFQDDNGNGKWDSGEGAGREDGTADGNAPYKTHNFPKPNPSANPPVDWKIDANADITIDSTTAQ
jgi:hypothetical protein